jgi:hypothetical protein
LRAAWQPRTDRIGEKARHCNGTLSRDWNYHVKSLFDR